MWISDLNNGEYQNPILHGDYSDPDVIRVGDDFFMTASSFNYSPGLPILHSKDLVNWKIVSYAIDHIPFPTYDSPQYGKGVFAPSLRYHNGEYYIYYGAPDEGVMMVKTKDPFGQWEAPKLIKEAKGWIDTCPFWDEDGNAYLVHAFAYSRCGINGILHLNKMSPDGTKLLDEGTLIIDGRKDHPIIEGPKMYKRKGYYYIFAPAGGVERGWQVVFRSKNIYGPYEWRIVLAQGKTGVNGPHQGGWIELENKESWFIHFQDMEAYGRILHLEPVSWVEDWPLIGQAIDQKGCGEPVMTYQKPNVGKVYPITMPDTSDYFDNKKLGLQWQWQANWKKEWYALKDDGLELYLKQFSEKGVNTVYELPNVLTQLIQMPDFNVTTKVSLHAKKVKDQCGLILTGTTYFYIALIQEEDGYYVQFVHGNESRQGRYESVKCLQKVESDTIYLRAHVYKQQNVLVDAIGQMSYSINGKDYEKIGLPFYLSPGVWVGAKIGLFATNLVHYNSEGNSRFEYIEIENA